MLNAYLLVVCSLLECVVLICTKTAKHFELFTATDRLYRTVNMSYEKTLACLVSSRNIHNIQERISDRRKGTKGTCEEHFALLGIGCPRYLLAANFLLIIIIAGVYSLPNNTVVELPPDHPCYNTTVNTSVTTSQGEKFLCLVPSEDDLLKQLKASGGYNKYYVAVTLEEANANFKSPLRPVAQLSWRNVSLARRRRSTEDEEYKLANSPDVEVEGVDRGGRKKGRSGLRPGLQKCEIKGNRTPEGYIKLCTECWYVTELPETKFPRFFTEQICEKDGNCNRGDGTCIQRFLDHVILTQTDGYKRIDPPPPDAQYSEVYERVWDAKGEPIRSCCQCQNV